MTKKEEAERRKVAKELCEKDGYDWNALDDYGKHSYEHYADVVIRNRPKPEEKPAKEILEAPSNKCTVCGGKGFIEEQAGLVQVQCEACGGTGIAQTEGEEEGTVEPPAKRAPVHKHYYRKGTDTCRCGHKRRKKKAK